MTVNYNGIIYYYLTNIQGDVVSIVDGDGTLAVHYVYDAWGNILSIVGTMDDTLGVINPLRYRGYVYDQETELYYLQSRYYSPKIGRFINADNYISTGQGILGSNMFAYCGNNPIMYADSSGTQADGVVCKLSGLNLPSDGSASSVTIDGQLYYYVTRYNGAGDLYEYWYDADGNLI